MKLSNKERSWKKQNLNTKAVIFILISLLEWIELWNVNSNWHHEGVVLVG
jgi:hypothetical protein